MACHQNLDRNLIAIGFVPSWCYASNEKYFASSPNSICIPAKKAGCHWIVCSFCSIQNLLFLLYQEIPFFRKLLLNKWIKAWIFRKTRSGFRCAVARIETAYRSYDFRISNLYTFKIFRHIVKKTMLLYQYTIFLFQIKDKALISLSHIFISRTAKNIKKKNENIKF